MNTSLATQLRRSCAAPAAWIVGGGCTWASAFRLAGFSSTAELRAFASGAALQAQETNAPQQASAAAARGVQRRVVVGMRPFRRHMMSIFKPALDPFPLYGRTSSYSTASETDSLSRRIAHVSFQIEQAVLSLRHSCSSVQTVAGTIPTLSNLESSLDGLQEEVLKAMESGDVVYQSTATVNDETGPPQAIPPLSTADELQHGAARAVHQRLAALEAELQDTQRTATEVRARVGEMESQRGAALAWLTGSVATADGEARGLMSAPSRDVLSVMDTWHSEVTYAVEGALSRLSCINSKPLSNPPHTPVSGIVEAMQGVVEELHTSVQRAMDIVRQQIDTANGWAEEQVARTSELDSARCFLDEIERLLPQRQSAARDEIWEMRSQLLPLLGSVLQHWPTHTATSSATSAAPAPAVTRSPALAELSGHLREITRLKALLSQQLKAALQAAVAAAEPATQHSEPAVSEGRVGETLAGGISSVAAASIHNSASAAVQGGSSSDYNGDSGMAETESQAEDAAAAASAVYTAAADDATEKKGSSSPFPVVHPEPSLATEAPAAAAAAAAGGAAAASQAAAIAAADAVSDGSTGTDGVHYVGGFNPSVYTWTSDPDSTADAATGPPPPGSPGETEAFGGEGSDVGYIGGGFGAKDMSYSADAHDENGFFDDAHADAANRHFFLPWMTQDLRLPNEPANHALDQLSHDKGTSTVHWPFKWDSKSESSSASASAEAEATEYEGSKSSDFEVNTDAISRVFGHRFRMFERHLNSGQNEAAMTGTAGTGSSRVGSTGASAVTAAAAAAAATPPPVINMDERGRQGVRMGGEPDQSQEVIRMPPRSHFGYREREVETPEWAMPPHMYR